MSTDRRIAALVPALREVAGPTDRPTDCPECGVPAAVLLDVCEVCLAEFDEVAPLRPASAGQPSHAGMFIFRSYGGQGAVTGAP